MGNLMTLCFIIAASHRGTEISTGFAQGVEKCPDFGVILE
jgi:hypothetical protein